MKEDRDAVLKQKSRITIKAGSNTSDEVNQPERNVDYMKDKNEFTINTESNNHQVPRLITEEVSKYNEGTYCENKVEEYTSFLNELPLHSKPNKQAYGLEIFCHSLVSFRRQILISFCMYLSYLSDGYNVSWPAPITVKLYNPDETPLPYIISETTASWISSAIFFGVFGTYVTGGLSNVIGRKPCLIIGGANILFAYILLTLANNVTLLCFGRFFAGLGQSITTVTSLMYIGEMASPEIRGMLMTLTGVFNNLGALLVYCVGPFTSYNGVNYVAICLAILFIICCCFIPDTPVFYVIKGNVEQAKSCLRYLGRSKDIDSELKKIIAKNNQKQSRRYLWRQLLFTKSNRRALFITVSMYFFQMNSGINFFMTFATTIFKAAGSSIQPHIATIIIGLTAFLGSIISPLFIDRFGRRLLLIISTAGCSISMTIMGIYFYLSLYYPPTIASLGWLPLFIMIVAFIAYGAGLNVVPHTLTSEMYSPKVRGLGSSLSLISAWMSGFFSITVSGYLIVYLGNHIAFWVFAAVNAIAMIFTMVFVPETTGKTLTEIDDMMDDNQSIH